MDNTSYTQILETKIRQVRPACETADRYYVQQLAPDLRLCYHWDHSSVPHWFAAIEAAAPAGFPHSYEGWVQLIGFSSWSDTRKGYQGAAAGRFLTADGEGITLARIRAMLEDDLAEARMNLASAIGHAPDDDGTRYLSPVAAARDRVEWLTQRVAYTRALEETHADA